MDAKKSSSIKIVFIILSLLLGQRLTFGQEVSGAGVAQQADEEGPQAEYTSYIPMVVRDSFVPSSGVLDPSFDGDGIVRSDLSLYDDVGVAVALQPDGKLVVAGYIQDAYDSQFLLARYQADGSLDKTFGGGNGWVSLNLSFEDDRLSDVILLDDGKLLVAGSSKFSGSKDFFLARYNTDGSLDTSFDGDGWLTTDFEGYSDAANGLALGPDGKILVAGDSQNANDESFDFALARYNPDGSLDTNFDNDGWLTTDFFGQDDYANSLLLQPDGRIVVAGTATAPGNGYDFALARYHPDGSLDTSFSEDGFVATDLGLGDVISDILLQPDGKIVAGGGSSYVSAPNYSALFALARYNADGSLDTSFGEAGWVTTSFGWFDKGRAVQLQPDGKILMAGYTEWLVYASVNLGPSPNARAFALARYNPNGSLDDSFGEAGLVTTDVVPDMSDDVYDMLLQPDGRIVLLGSVENFVVLVRYK